MAQKHVKKKAKSRLTVDNRMAGHRLAKALVNSKNPIRPLGFPTPEEREFLMNGTLEGALFPSAHFGFGATNNQHDTLYDQLRWYLVSNERQLISQAFMELAVFQNFVCVPVDDAIAGGVEIVSEQLGEEACRELEMDMMVDQTLDTIAWGEKWARAYGGGGVLLFTGEDWATPLELDMIKAGDPAEWRAFDMWEMFGDTVNPDGWNQMVASEINFTHYNYYGSQVHKSHTVKMTGMIVPSFIRPRLRGWGASCLDSIMTSINQFIKSRSVDFELLDEAKVDVFKMTGLVTMLLSADGEAEVRKRINTANRSKNYKNALVIDKDDDYEQKQISFSGIADLKKEWRIELASDLRMPQLKLFGLSSAGLNNSSEEELEVYNTMVEGGPRKNLRPAIKLAIQVKCRQKWGSIPDDLTFNFKPLRQLTAEQEQNVKNAEYQRVLSARTSGLISDKQFAEMCNKAKLLPMPLETAGLSDELEKPEDQDPEGGDKKKEPA